MTRWYRTSSTATASISGSPSTSGSSGRGISEFSHISQPDRHLWEELTEVPLQGREQPPEIDPRDGLCILRDAGSRPRVLGFLTLRTVNSGGLYEALGDTELADYVRKHTAGRVQLLTGLYTARGSSGSYDVGQLLMTEALSRSLGADCSYAVWHATASEETLDLLERQGFVPAELPSAKPLLLVDMRSPSVLLQNIPTTLKEPFSSDRTVLAAVRAAHCRMQRALTGLYPGSLILSLNAEVIYHRLVRKIVDLNGVPAEPTVPRVLGPKMCVPFGKILRGNAIPNTVTKTIHTDKVFARDLTSFDIENFPGYAPLESQIRTIHSFRRPVILVDDLLHSGNRIRALDPLFRQEGVVIDRVLVGLLSGRGRDSDGRQGPQCGQRLFHSEYAFLVRGVHHVPLHRRRHCGAWGALRPRPDPSGEPDPALRLPPLLPGVRTGGGVPFLLCLPGERPGHPAGPGDHLPGAVRPQPHPLPPQ